MHGDASSEAIDIFMELPVDDGVSDQDSDKSDGDYEFNANHLGWKLLSTGCDVRRRSSRLQQHTLARYDSDSE